MTVKELKSLLQGCDDDRMVVLSIDSEGNGFNELRTVEGDMMFDEINREVGLETLTEADIEQGFTEVDVFKEGKRAVILWP